MKGKWRAEDEGEGEGASKRPKVGPMALEWMEQRWGGDEEMGSWIVEALWALNSCLGAIEGELVASWEAVLESMWLLCQSMVYNLRQIEMRGNQKLEDQERLRSQRDRQRSRWSKQSKWRGTCIKMNISKIIKNVLGFFKKNNK